MFEVTCCLLDRRWGVFLGIYLCMILTMVLTGAQFPGIIVKTLD